jgi:hypothetical protein
MVSVGRTVFAVYVGSVCKGKFLCMIFRYVYVVAVCIVSVLYYNMCVFLL